MVMPVLVAIRIGDNKSIPALFGALDRDQGGMFGIDLWEQNWRMWVLTKCARVGADRCASFGKERLNRFRFS